jgi:AraC family transcriptional activator of pobA
MSLVIRGSIGCGRHGKVFEIPPEQDNLDSMVKSRGSCNRRMIRAKDVRQKTRVRSVQSGKDAAGPVFVWASSRTMRFTDQGEFPLTFPPECPFRHHCLEFSLEDRLTPSYHDCLEITFIYEGAGRFTVENRAYPVTAGDLVLVGKRQFHLMQADGTQPARIIALHFMPELVSQVGGPALDFEYVKPFHYRSAWFSHRIRAADMPEDLLLDRIRRIDQAIRQGGDGYPLAVKTYLIDILLEVSHHCRRSNPGWLRPDKSARDFDRLHAAIGYLNQHYPEPISLSLVAKLVSMSPNYFCRFFKDVTGHTLTDFVLRMRVDRAVELLSDSAMSVAEIAYQCGFSSQSYFGRVFKRLKGLTPQQYRRTH